MVARIHPTAIVHPEAEVHDTCEIGPYCTVDKGVKLGPDNKLISHVVIQNNTKIGKKNTFFPFAMIGAVPQDLKYNGEDTELIIGDNNTLRESCSLHIGTVSGGGVTKVGNNNLIMGYVHLAHDVIIGNHTILGNASQLAGHVIIEDHAILGGLVAVSQFIRVGTHSYTGGFSGIDRDLAPFSMGRGNSTDFQIRGMNLVGLKRRKVNPDVIAALQQVNQIFYKEKDLERDQALKKIEEEVEQFTEVKQFVEFVRAAKKGIYR